jgi:3-hydroxy-9,10-secoandrosta-1,3,5(10)-triene-9,17-dione monooxygenase
MSAQPGVAPEIPLPEPELTPAAMIARARAMRETLRGRQTACEALGRIPEETHEEFLRAGFYRILQPRSFGGYEFSFQAFVRIMVEVSRGCPESGWVLALISAHAAVIAAFPEQGQREVFGETGDMRAPGVAPPGGVAIRTVGGYRIKAAWDYASGCDVGTHFFGTMIVQDAGSDAPRGTIFVLLDRADFRIIDNWNVIGMQGTGSRRVVTDEMFVPSHRVLELADENMQPVTHQPGRNLHGNPLYHCPHLPLYVGELAAVAVGAAKGALDVYEEILRTKKSAYPPFEPRFELEGLQRQFGEAQGLIDTAEAALLKMAEDYVENARLELEESVPYTAEKVRRLVVIEQRCVQMAWEAVDLMFRTAGSSSAAKTATLGRYFRNLAVIRTHTILQLDHTATNAARLYFGLPALTPV